MHKELQNSTTDYLHKMTKVALGSIPVVGTLAAEIFTSIFEEPINKRKNDLLNSLAKEIEKLKETFEEFDAKKLSKNDNFINITLYAIQIALRNNKKEKIDSIINASLNSALNITTKEDMQLMFINFIDILTPTQLQLISIFNDPNIWIKNIGLDFNYKCPTSLLLDSLYPDKKLNIEYYNQLTIDLNSKGLIKNRKFDLTVNGKWQLTSQTTPLGKEFVKFITYPTEIIF